MMKQTVAICWFRRDLRLNDHAALFHALKSGFPVVPLFIFDRSILDELEDKQDKRVAFIHQALGAMNLKLYSINSSLEVYYGFPGTVFDELINRYDIKAVFTNHDYEPYAQTRDQEIKQLLSVHNIPFHTYKDQVIFEKSEVVKDDGNPYSVFTPYSKRWKANLNDFYLRGYPAETLFSNFLKQTPQTLPSLSEMGFQSLDAGFPSPELNMDIVRNYKEQRDFPSLPGTSKLSVHLRFGTISIRELVRIAKDQSEHFLNELIWRDFYQMILWNFPQVGNGKSFKPEYDHIQWRNNETEFEAWCKGETGYPIVDAGMRELNATGFMHNRVRMIVASFLTKHLLIDWRWGEAYFAKKLLDFDLAANNGGWQWAAGSGCDAAPYFRIFNPYLQTQKFDPDLKYVRKWVPEFEGFNYVKPIIAHDYARKRCLEVYSKALKKELN